MLKGQNILVIDTECLRSADSCKRCERYEDEHAIHGYCVTPELHGTGARYTKLGWESRVALGLSIGCAYEYAEDRFVWFDQYTLENFVRHCVDTEPLLVSFNGVLHDFPLMRGLLRQKADLLTAEGTDTVARALQLGAKMLRDLCNAFKVLCTQSYDVLQAIWAADPGSVKVRGLNSLGAISEANGYGSKEMDGATAPRLWAQGRYAEVINYCQGDVLKTRALFEQILTTGSILRSDGKPLNLPVPGELRSLVERSMAHANQAPAS